MVLFIAEESLGLPAEHSWVIHLANHSAGFGLSCLLMELAM